MKEQSLKAVSSKHLEKANNSHNMALNLSNHPDMCNKHFNSLSNKI